MNIIHARQRILTITALLLGLTLCLLVLLECIEIVLRYGFSTTLIWWADVSALLLLLLGWLGAGHLWIARKHLVVDLFQGRFPRFFKWVSLVAEVVVLVGILWLAPKVVDTLSIYTDIVMPSLEVPAAIRFVPLVIGLFLISLGSILSLSEAVFDSNRAGKSA